MSSTDDSPGSRHLTLDSVLGGRVRFIQPSSGYRVNVDSVLLADFARRGRAATRAVDLGAGVGLVALLLSALNVARELLLVEREPELAELARRNLEMSTATGQVLLADAIDLPMHSELRHVADVVCCNPPFFDLRSHRPSRIAIRERARFGEITPFVQAAAFLLSGPKARAVFAYPARALPDLLEAARCCELVPKRLRFVHPMLERPARLCLLELRRARPGGLVVETPLVEWQSHGVPTEEMRRVSAGPAGDRT